MSIDPSNSLEFMVSGPYLRCKILDDPWLKQDTYLVPTYYVLKRLCEKIYWIPMLNWVIDDVRVMNTIDKIQFASNEWFVSDVCYQVKAHLEFENAKMEKRAHYYLQKAREKLEQGNIKTATLGDSRCPVKIEPCIFGTGKSVYDWIPIVDFGKMFHSTLYSHDNKAYANTYDQYIMKHGCIHFVETKKCSDKRIIA